MWGTIVTTGLALFTSGIVNYATDAFRDLTGVEESARLPRVIKQKSSRFKKYLAAGFAAATLGLTYEVYNVAHNLGYPRTKEEQSKSKTTQVQNLNRSLESKI